MAILVKANSVVLTAWNYMEISAEHSTFITLRHWGQDLVSSATIINLGLDCLACLITLGASFGQAFRNIFGQCCHPYPTISVQFCSVLLCHKGKYKANGKPSHHRLQAWFSSVEIVPQPKQFEISYLQMVYSRSYHVLPQNQMIVLSIVFK